MSKNERLSSISNCKHQARYLLKNVLESSAYRVCREGTTGLNKSEMKHIVFVCKGNICRSAFAEKYLRSILNEKAYIVESGGMDVGNRTQSPYEAILAGRELGVDLQNHYSKTMLECDLDSADMILPMEYEQYNRIIQQYPPYECKTVLLGEFLPKSERLLINIYDPFGMGIKEFRRCFNRIKCALDEIKRRAVR